MVHAVREPELSKQTLINSAREIFGNPRKAHSWLTRPNQSLHDMRPIDLLECGSEQDLREVFDELSRIDQGLF